MPRNPSVDVSQTKQKSPVLITGMPRSGTTWLARLIASAPGCALTGREPMCPRGGNYGNNYALGGTLREWTRLESPTGRQRRALRTSYRGVNPLVYGRYGVRAWTAPLPGTRVVVKDPFAMLSMPTVHRLTGATSVLLFRHPGASLTSYRRMGWVPDTDELRPITADFTAKNGAVTGVTQPPSPDAGETAMMAWFWNALYGMALHDAKRIGEDVVVVAHEDIAGGGTDVAERLFERLGLQWGDRVAEELNRSGSSRKVDTAALHNLDRNPAQVAHEWANKISAQEREQLESATQDVHELLQQRAHELMT